MPMLIYIYKNNLGDCTNNGVSSRDIKGLCLTNVDGPFEPCKDYPKAELVLQDFGYGKSVKIVPHEVIDKNPMFGGNFGETSDSRFSEKVSEMLGHNFYGAVAIHDRVE